MPSAGANADDLSYLLQTISEMRSLARLDATAKRIWAEWAGGVFTDDQAAALGEAVSARKGALRAEEAARALPTAAF